MKRLLFILFIIFAFSLTLISPVFASDVDGTVAVTSSTVPDTSDSEAVTLNDINNTLSVIQSQLWIILVVGLLGFVYKFFRIFF